MTYQNTRLFWLTRFFLLLMGALVLAGPVGGVFADDEEDEIPDPEDITIETRDNVLLRCTYYPSRLKDKKKAIPIMMLPGWKGRRVEYDYLATRLQSIGYACISVDLRGHGESTETKMGFPKLKELDRMRPTELTSMQNDIDAVKLFLRKENDQERLNLEALTIIASDFSSVIATNWVVHEFSWPDYPGRRQGKNVKALIFLSPSQKEQGLTCTKTLGAPAVLAQSVLLISGAADANPEYRQALEFHKKLERGIPDPEPIEGVDPITQRRLFFVKKPVSIQGTRLLDPKLGLKTDADIARFLKLRLVDHLDEFKWSRRSAADE